MLRKWLTKKLSIHDDDPVVKEFRRKSYARRHTVDVDSFRMTSSTSMAHSGSGGEEQTDQEMMAEALAKHSKSYEDHRIGGPYRRHRSVTSPLRSSSPSAGLSHSPQPLSSGMVRLSASGGLRPRLTTVPSTDCPAGAEGGQNEEEKEKGASAPEATDTSAGPGCGDGNDAKLEEANAEGLTSEVKETKAEVEGGGGGEGGGAEGGGGARTKAGTGGGGGRGGGRSGGKGRGTSGHRFRKAGQSKAGGCSGFSGSFKRRSLRRGTVKQNGLKVDTSQPLIFPTTPETILEYHKQKPILDENEEWLVVELNEFECLVDSLDVLRIIAKHSKFFEVSPDELWEEFFEFVDTVPSYDEVINFDVWQEFRDKKYTC